MKIEMEVKILDIHGIAEDLDALVRPSPNMGYVSLLRWDGEMNPTMTLEGYVSNGKVTLSGNIQLSDWAKIMEC